jgi:hypothetical protein
MKRLLAIPTFLRAAADLVGPDVVPLRGDLISRRSEILQAPAAPVKKLLTLDYGTELRTRFERLRRSLGNKRAKKPPISKGY